MLRALIVGLALATPAAADDHPIVASIKPKLKSPDKPFAMIVKVKVKDGKGDALTAAFNEARTSVVKESGYLAYDVYQDADDPATFVFFEKWKNLDGLVEHIKAAHTEKLLAALPEFLDGAPDIKIVVPATAK